MTIGLMGKPSGIVVVILKKKKKSFYFSVIDIFYIFAEK